MGKGVICCLAIAVVFSAGCGGTGSSDTSSASTTVDPPLAAPSASPPPALTKQSARDLVREHYREVNAGDYDKAFGEFSPDARIEIGSKSAFVTGYKDTLTTRVHDVKVVSRQGHEQALVTFGLSATAKDVCGDQIEQEYEGSWIVKARSSGLVLDHSEIQQLDGDVFVSSAADCPPDSGNVSGAPSPPPSPTSTPTPPPPTSDCDPNYSGCLDPNSYDYDCAGGSGDGPDYVSGPVSVYGSDPFGLDADGNGVGCE